MMIKKRLFALSLLLTSAFMFTHSVPTVAQPAASESSSTGVEERLNRLESSLTQIQEERTKEKLQVTVPQPRNESFFGYGPAFSHVYFSDQTFSSGLIADFLYEARRGEPDLAGINQFRLFLGYKLSTNWIFNSALAIDVASPGRTNPSLDNSLHLDFAYLDWTGSDVLTVRTGLVPVPLGLRRLAPEPNLYPDPLRPRVEEWLLPFDASRPGAIALLDFKFWRLHGGAISSPEVRRLTNGTFIEGGLSSRFRNGQFDESETFAGVIRADYSIPDDKAPGTKPLFEVGASHLQGDAAHASSGVDHADFTISEMHVRFQKNGWQLIGLGAMGTLTNTGEIQTNLSLRPGSRARGWNASLYREVITSPGPASLLEAGVFVSGEGFELENADIGVSRAVRAGINIKPIPNVVFKAARQWRLSSELDQDLWQLSLGALF